MVRTMIDTNEIPEAAAERFAFDIHKLLEQQIAVTQQIIDFREEGWSDVDIADAGDTTLTLVQTLGGTTDNDSPPPPLSQRELLAADLRAAADGLSAARVAFFKTVYKASRSSWSRKEIAQAMDHGLAWVRAALKESDTGPETDTH